ncbi:MAG: hypothetical protein ACREBI_11650 [Nitrosotalea sp.]
MKTSSILLLSLTATLVFPVGFSGVQADDQSNDTAQTSSDTNQTISFGFSNQTNPNGAENIGLQISNFVHNATALFQQEKAENIQAIKECHQKMQNVTSENRTQVIDECHATMNTIREKYQDARKQFQELFKQFRENILVLRHDAEGQHVSDQDKQIAMKNINEDAAKHGMTGINTALEHMKGIGVNGSMGIERTLEHVNQTNNENNNQHTTFIPPMLHGQGSHGPLTAPGQSGSHGKH